MRRALALAAALTLAAQAPHPGGWTTVGPGGGGSLFFPTVSPHSPRTVLVACDMTGSYLTRDGGESWREFNLRGPVRLFAFDPTNARVMYAATTSALYRSADEGDSWKMILPRPESVRAITMGDDHAEETIETSAGAAGPVDALAVDASGSLYAAVATTLWQSTDSGATWRKDSDLPARARGIWVARDGALYAASDNAVSVRREGKWRTGPSPGAFSDISGAPPVFYATTGGHIYVSEDGGGGWRESGLPGFQGRASVIATSANHPDTAYVSFEGLRTPISWSLGVARTSDRGRHWELVWQDVRYTASNVHDAWISRRFGPGWPGNPIGIGVAPNDAAVAYTSDAGRVMRTTDGGKTWEQAYSKGNPGVGWSTTGIDATTCYGIHFDPFDARHEFLSCTDIGLFASGDGGARWHSATTSGVPPNWINTTYWLEFDPSVRGRMWAAMSGTHDLPRPKMWRAHSPATYRGGVVESDDGGNTWRVAGEGIPEAAVTHVLLDPASPANARVLYAAAFGHGVFRTSDGGRHWLLKNDGIEGPGPSCWRLARDASGALYLAVARRSDDGSFGNPGDGALYRSTDGAEHWTRLPLPERVNGPNGLAIDPTDARRIYLAAWGRSVRSGAVDGGIFLSTDGGASWRNVLHDDQHIYDVTVDPRDPKVLYAAGFESAAWRSTDRGLHWRRIEGFDFKWGHRVIPDPVHEGMIYITTFGGGVWHGPVK